MGSGSHAQMGEVQSHRPLMEALDAAAVPMRFECGRPHEEKDWRRARSALGPGVVRAINVGEEVFSVHLYAHHVGCRHAQGKLGLGRPGQPV